MTVHDAVSGTSQPAVRPGIAVPTFRIDFSREVDDPVFNARFVPFDERSVTLDFSKVVRAASKVTLDELAIFFRIKSTFNERIVSKFVGLSEIPFWNFVFEILSNLQIYSSTF